MGSMEPGRRTLAVIPARGGSKEIRGKNLRDVEGKPLIGYMIETALACRHLTRVIVSTDSPAIADAARAHGAEVPFLRPPDLATDTVPLPPVMRHAMEYFDAQGFRADHVVSLQPTSPLILPSDIDAAVEKAWDTGCDTVVSLRKVDEAHPWRMYTIDGDRVRPFNEYTNEKVQNRQERPDAYKFSGAIYVRRRGLLEQADGSDFALGTDVRFVFVPSERAVDVNSPLDLLLFKAIMAERKGRQL
jgi:CMP-N-acetylneuraminic acid synthetase